MGAAGTLVISLTADTGQATGDIGKAAHQIERDMQTMAIKATAAGYVIGEAIGEAARAAARLGTEILMLGDRLGKMSQRSGFTVERLSEIAFAGDLADVSLTNIGTSLGYFNKQIVDAERKGSKASEMFQALGVDITAGPQVAFEQMAKAINNLPDGDLKSATMRQAFGRAGEALIPLISGLEDATEKANKLGIVMSTQMAEDSEKFNDAMTTLSASGKALALQAMMPLATWLATVSENMVQARLNGNTLSVGLLEIGKTWASMWGGMAEAVGATRLATAMESEFNRLDGMVRALTDKNPLIGDVNPGGLDGALGDRPVDPEKLRRAVAGARDPKTKTGRGARDDNLLGRQLQEDMDAWAKIMAEASQLTSDFYQKQREGEAELEATRMKAWLEFIDRQQEFEDAQTRLANGFDENGKKIVESSKKAKDLARELGLTFSSAFEDAIVSGKKFSDVLKGLAQDILRIMARKMITEPIGNAISDGIGSIFGDFFSFDGGGSTGMGPRSGGMDGKGGFLAMLHPQESVIDHTRGQTAGGGHTFYVDNRGASVEAVQRLERFVMQINGSIEQRAVSAVSDTRRRGGTFSRNFS